MTIVASRITEPVWCATLGSFGHRGHGDEGVRAATVSADPAAAR
jgi:hypothetical protein